MRSVATTPTSSVPFPRVNQKSRISSNLGADGSDHRATSSSTSRGFREESPLAGAIVSGSLMNRGAPR